MSNKPTKRESRARSMWRNARREILPIREAIYNCKPYNQHPDALEPSAELSASWTAARAAVYGCWDELDAAVCEQVEDQRPDDDDDDDWKGPLWEATYTGSAQELAKAQLMVERIRETDPAAAMIISTALSSIETM